MTKFIIFYSASGYDGDDGYCFGNADLIAIKDSREEAVQVAREYAQDIINDFYPRPEDLDLDEEERPTDEAYEAAKNKAIDYEENWDQGKLISIFITHYDEMFPHFGVVRIVETEI